MSRKRTTYTAKFKTRFLGEIELTNSISSYGCDKQLHFHHPRTINI